MKQYRDFLKQELNNYEGSFDKFILYAPDFFDLLCRLLEEKISKEDRRIINSALAYFVVPNDVIPEETFGPMGYVDDIFVCVRALDHIKDKYGITMLESLWQNDEELAYVMEYCRKESTEILERDKLIRPVLEASALE